MSEAERNLRELCRQYQALLLNEDEKTITVALAGMPTTEMLEALHFTSQRRVQIERWPQARLEQYQQAEASGAGSMPEPITPLVDHLLLRAFQRRASDIHIEPCAAGMRVRLRIDGVLQPLQNISETQQAALIARLKILGNLDIAERRLPQDGQFTLQLQGVQAAFRLSTLPVRAGEKAVIRLLQSESQDLALDKLGMPPAALTHFRSALAQPQGLILVTGPTGSGKTFTLYSGLNALNQPGSNLCSVEDPVEIPLPGVNQTQINPRAGLDFQRVLRALLRQDPDVIMLGEIRDAESAEIAVKAAQTGHLVLSTLHTNSTTETLTRLGQMGIPGYLLASALRLVIAQRLVRRLCPHCRAPAEKIEDLPAQSWTGSLQNWQAVGCDHCFSGYYGRLALFEMLPINSELQTAIADNASSETLSLLAQRQQLNSLFVEGLNAVNRGETSLAEVYRVIGVGHG
ncbi:type II secretion system protein GspE [Mixta theicola]|uniref:Type II secretion system protein GspE n=1 Tax=Mixta theicola TaxID=1458355 RepID=A0A2K1Q978_9GAMM|nr:type II secretion system protein GspE [Mixta theicola]PNS11585.1 type II secretion system protein GspE [Mixta theicola]GLR08677.1 type II secretion system protein GspE [Mixta theicola]